MNSLTFLTTSPPEPSHSWHITSTSRNFPEINLCQLHKSSFTGSVLFSDAQEIFTKVEVSFLLQALHGQLELHHLVVEVLYLGLGCRATAAVSCARCGSTCGPGGGPGGGGRLPRLNIAVVSGELIIDVSPWACWTRPAWPRPPPAHPACWRCPPAHRPACPARRTPALRSWHQRTF